MKFIGNTKEYLHLQVLEKDNCSVFDETVESSLMVLWFESESNVLNIDGEEYTFGQNQIVFLTEFHKVKVRQIDKIRFLRFNKPFYCVLDHDIEVGCKGILFFGASQLPIVKIPEEELERFETLWKVFQMEMQSKDSLQIDMLQMMLKRYLILCTRLYKLQGEFPEHAQETDIVREFNYLVEQHFREKHNVSDYAELLNKSPKTLANIFSGIGNKTPLKYIQERRMLEARRLLRYTDHQIKEIAYDIGFNDVQSFSRFFKKQEGIYPSAFREMAE